MKSCAALGAEDSQLSKVITVVAVVVGVEPLGYLSVSEEP
jgi:hypothetical protein